MISHPLRTRHLVVVLATGCVAATVLAACSSSKNNSAAPAGYQPSGSPSAGVGRAVPNGAGNFGAAAAGEIAAVSGRTLQVQSTTEQTAVTYSAKTAFTAQRATTRAAVKTGACIVAMSAASAAPQSGSSRTATAITAATVEIQSGSCTGTFGGGNRPGTRTGTRPAGFPSGRPSGFPSGARSGRGFAGGAFADRVTGKVTAVTGSTITVQAPTFSRSGSSTPGPSTTPRTVHLTAKTTYRTTVTATSAAAKVGMCAVVQGTTDSSGSVAATRIALSSKTNGTCSVGPRG